MKNYIFSDTNPLREDLIKEKTKDIFEIATKIFLSHQIKRGKNDMQTYEYIINEIGLKPEEILFIDDHEKNIVLAQKAGINGILYENSKKLRQDLDRLL